MSQNASTASKVWGVISTVIVVIVVLIAVFLMGSRIMGYRVFNVISGSMEPTYSVGDLIYVKEVDPEDIKVGDPITFVMNENLVVATHRVVEIDADNQHFYTKGDANEDVDASPVHYNNVVGVAKFSIPLLGYVSDFIQNPPGMYIAIALGIMLIVAVFLPDLIKKSHDKNVKSDTAQAAHPVAEIPFEETAVGTEAENASPPSDTQPQNGTDVQTEKPEKEE